MFLDHQFQFLFNFVVDGVCDYKALAPVSVSLHGVTEIAGFDGDTLRSLWYQRHTLKEIYSASVNISSKICLLVIYIQTPFSFSALFDSLTQKNTCMQKNLDKCCGI